MILFFRFPSPSAVSTLLFITFCTSRIGSAKPAYAAVSRRLRCTTLLHSSSKMGLLLFTRFFKKPRPSMVASRFSPSIWVASTPLYTAMG